MKEPSRMRAHTSHTTSHSLKMEHPHKGMAYLVYKPKRRRYVGKKEGCKSYVLLAMDGAKKV